MLESLFSGRELKVLGSKEDIKHGDIYSMNEFAEMVEDGSLIDYDGHASEIIIGGNIVSDEAFGPSYFEDHLDKFLELQKKHDKIEIVWYNR